MATADQNYKETIDLFYGGVSDDPRIQKAEIFQIAQHFDIWTNPKKLAPYRQMVADVDATAKGYKIDGFAYENSGLYGVGRSSGGTNNKIYQKPVFSAVSGTWAAAPSGTASSANGFGHVLCITYHDRLYVDAGLQIDSYGTLDPSGTYTNDAYTPGGVVACQGIITTDDLLIVPTTFELAVKDGKGSGPTDKWSVMLTLPDNRQILDLCEWGNFVAVATHPGGGYNPQIGSKVALWDKANVDVYSWIDWGEGDLRILDDLEGTLIGVSTSGQTNDEGSIKPKLTIRQYTGGNEAQVLFELEGDEGEAFSVSSNLAKFKDGNRLIFGLNITKDGQTYYQLASVGRKSAAYPWSFTLDRLVDNQNAITEIDATFKLSQTVFVAFNGDGSINRTDDTATYTTATYISQIITGDSKVQDAHRRFKQLLMAGVLTTPLTTGQSVSLSYRTDGGSWKLIRTYAYGDDSNADPAVVPPNMGFEAGAADVNGDGTDLEPFVNYKELEFMVQSSGGAQPTGIVYAWKLTGANLATE